MLFLLNDVVLNLDKGELAPPVAAARFRKLSMAAIQKLGAELFADDPLLHHHEPGKAKRLASLINAKVPNINAALFLAPSRGCLIKDVQIKFCEIDFAAMAALYEQHRAGALTTLEADRQIWRRLAA